jgi:hypothetical protein
MGEFTVVQLGDIEEVSDGRVPSRPVRHRLGIRSFGINAFTGRAAGDRLINEHDEADAGGEYAQEELYLVHSGRARFELDGEQVDAPAGSLVYCAPAVTRTAFAEEPGTTLIALGGTPGKAYEVAGWELWQPVGVLYQDGRYEEAAEQGRAVIAENPDAPLVLYNTACCESLTGQTEQAVAHLREAISQMERLRAYAAGDSDLDAIREEPGVKELLAQPA